MRAGKTVVGRMLAERLGWGFIDFDQAIEQRENRRVADIFSRDGERHFRGLEAQLTHEVEGQQDVVLAPGGGWITQPGLFERLRSGSLYVWLRVQPETVFTRQSMQTAVTRPLLAVEHPLDSIRRLLSEREPHYSRADAVIDTDGQDPADVATCIAEMLES